MSDPMTPPLTPQSSKESDRVLTLVPMAPGLFKRNKQRNTRVQIQVQHIPIALFTEAKDPEPPYLPQGWGSCVNPSGTPYFHRKLPSNIATQGNYPPLNVVTVENMISGQMVQLVHRLSNMIADMLKNKNIKFSDSYELYLESLEDSESPKDPEPPKDPESPKNLESPKDPKSLKDLELSEDGPNAWGYYIVDHSKRSVFWPEDVRTEDVEMKLAFSLDHLRHELKEMYWFHVGLYPSHDGIPTNGVARDFLSMLVYGQGDALTSSGSSFPFSAEECARYTKMIKPYRSEPMNDQILCIVARLNSSIAASQFINHFGLPHCRTDRYTSILAINRVPTCRLFSTLSDILFGIPASFAYSLERVYNDEVVHISSFREFFASCQEDRRTFINFSLVAMLMHLGLIATDFGLRHISAIGLFCDLVSFVSSTVLYYKHQEISEGTVTTANTYLSKSKSDTYGFQPLAILFSLPKAMFFWNFAFFVPQVLFIFCSSIGWTHLFGFVLPSMWLALVIQCKLVPNGLNWLPPSFQRRIERLLRIV